MNVFLQFWDKSFLYLNICLPASVFLLFIIDWTDRLLRRQNTKKFITILWFILYWSVLTVGRMCWDWSRIVIIILIALYNTTCCATAWCVSHASQNRTYICSTVRFMNEIWVSEYSQMFLLLITAQFSNLNIKIIEKLLENLVKIHLLSNY